MTKKRKIRVDIDSDTYAMADIAKMENHCFISIIKYKNKKPISVKQRVCSNMTEVWQFLAEHTKREWKR